MCISSNEQQNQIKKRSNTIQYTKTLFLKPGTEQSVQLADPYPGHVIKYASMAAEVDASNEVLIISHQLEHRDGGTLMSKH